MSNARYLVVPGVTIRHQIAGKALKEVRGPFSAAVRLVLKDSDGLFTSFSAAKNNFTVGLLYHKPTIKYIHMLF